MGMTIDTPFIAHSELTDEIYVIDKKTKYCVTDQVMKAVVATNRAIPKAEYENRLKADMLAMLYKLRSEIINMPKYFPYTDQTRWFIDGDDVEGYIDEKINSLKREE